MNTFPPLVKGNNQMICIGDVQIHPHACII